MSEELKPCPFCGGPADVMTFGEKNQYCTISCCACHAKINRNGKAIAIRDWNTRVKESEK